MSTLPPKADMCSATRDVRPSRIYTNVIRRRHSEGIGWDRSFEWGLPMKTRSDYHSNFEADQLWLLGAAAMVLLVFVLTLF